MTNLDIVSRVINDMIICVKKIKSDTLTITTPNTAIQNALDAYVGSGTRLLPERIGEKIIVQNNNVWYTFNEDLSYNYLIFENDSYIQCTTTGWIRDIVLPA